MLSKAAPLDLLQATVLGAWDENVLAIFLVLINVLDLPLPFTPSVFHDAKYKEFQDFLTDFFTWNVFELFLVTFWAFLFLLLELFEMGLAEVLLTAGS